MDVEIIKRSDAAKGFEVLPADGSSRGPSLARTLPPPRQDFEATIASAIAWVFVANIRTLTRRIASA